MSGSDDRASHLLPAVGARALEPWAWAARGAGSPIVMGLCSALRARMGARPGAGMRGAGAAAAAAVVCTAVLAAPCPAADQAPRAPPLLHIAGARQAGGQKGCQDQGEGGGRQASEAGGPLPARVAVSCVLPPMLSLARSSPRSWRPHEAGCLRMLRPALRAPRVHDRGPPRHPRPLPRAAPPAARARARRRARSRSARRRSSCRGAGRRRPRRRSARRPRSARRCAAWGGTCVPCFGVAEAAAGQARGAGACSSAACAAAALSRHHAACPAAARPAPATMPRGSRPLLPLTTCPSPAAPPCAAWAGGAGSQGRQGGG